MKPKAMNTKNLKKAIFIVLSKGWTYPKALHKEAKGEKVEF